MFTFTANIEEILDTAEDKYATKAIETDNTRDAIIESVREVNSQIPQTYAMIQCTYYVEQILSKTEYPQSAISDHLIEDAGTNPHDITSKAFKNALKAHLWEFHDHRYSSSDQYADVAKEPQPTYSEETYTHDSLITTPHQSEFQRILRDISPTSRYEDIKAADEDHLHEIELKMGEHLLDKNIEWSWTKQASFIRYLLTHSDKEFYIPREQLEHSTFADIIGSLVYWAWVAYFRDKATIADDQNESNITNLNGRHNKNENDEHQESLSDF
jgi:hypothetical protein